MGSNIPEETKGSDFETEENIAHQESLGAHLRKERLKKGLNLQEIADGTCIHIATLKALEEDDDSRMPAEVFTRGFLRLYAEYIGIDSEDVLARYDRAKGEAAPRGGDQTDPARRKKSKYSLMTCSGRKIPAVLLLLILIILGLFLFSGNIPFLK